jgi:alcohol dehydrogenase class IV
MTDFPAFAFSTVAHIVSELGAAHKLGEHIAQRFPSVRRALLVTDPGFLATGLVDAPAASLRTAGLQVDIYSNVVADPPEQIVLEAVEARRGRSRPISSSGSAAVVRWTWPS